mmetsp:Transcript_27505/g.68371  ORF Transcript_27505/g.68371 Transcript_27505/m.68371 type:complete len:161 (-) Transcript_27505:847-1329(-)
MSVQFDYYDESLGNAPSAECLLSLETDNNFYISTSGALPYWREPADEAEDRMTIPVVFIESILRRAPVPNPGSLKERKCLESTLSLDFINNWVSVLVDELGMISPEDGDEDAVKDFADFDELPLHATSPAPPLRRRRPSALKCTQRASRMTPCMLGPRPS